MKNEIVDRLKQTEGRVHMMHSQEMATLAKVEAAMLAGARKAFEAGGYTEITVPHLTRATGACENFDTLFETDYMGQPAYMSQTGQLYLEAFVPTLDKVCCAGPSFRAETEVDGRHLTEFTLLEIELQTDLDGLRKEIEKIIVGMGEEVIGRTGEELAYLGVNENRLADKLERPFRVMTYTEAVATLKPYFPNIEWGDDLKSGHEAKLVERVGNKPLFVTHFPQKIKFFNMRENRNDKTVVNSMDLLLPYGGEAVGSAEREEDYKRLEKRLYNSEMLDLLIKRKTSNGEWEGLTYGERKEEAVEIFRWYLDFVRENPVEHAGCGIGGTRVMQFITECPDIRASTVYPMNMESIL